MTTVLPINSLIALLVLVAFTGTVNGQDDQTKSTRVAQGLLHLYTFDSVDGKTIHDRSGSRQPLNLSIDHPDRVYRTPGSLLVRGKTTIRSERPATALASAIKRTGTMSIEAWITPKNATQEGPARIVTLSQNGSNRNFTLGQEGSVFDVRLRTTKTTTNGIPSNATNKNVAKPSLTHVVYTRDRSGDAKIYLNGRLNKSGKVAGSTGNWDDRYHLGLANELSNDRPWQGTIHLVAIYSRALNASEVAKNFAAGADASAGQRPAISKELANQRFFEHKIAPLLSKHCLECHDTASKKGGLDLSRKEAAFHGGESGKAIIAEKKLESLIFVAVQDDTMPAERDPLTEEEKTALATWIDQGAHWPIDWVDPAVYRHDTAQQTWIRRLTVDEYIATVKAAVNVDISDHARHLLPRDSRADGFLNTAYNLNVDFEHVDAYSKLASIIVDKMDTQSFTARFTKKKRLIDDDMRGLINAMGKWILRGPLDEREVVDFRGITTTVASAGGTFDEAAGLVIEAMLQSPRFLYRIENQRGDGSRLPVNEYELASRLSFIVWGSPPDKPLFEAAESGDIFDPQEFNKHVKRMLNDPRARQRSEQFLIQWLDLDRLDNLRPNKEMFPNWNASIANDMREETIAFFHEVVWEQNQPLSKLMNSQVSFISPQLAKHYGINANPVESNRYDLSSIPSRGGLLTHGSTLTIGGDDASMVTRGLFVLNDLLFSEVGDPPPGLDTTPVPPSPGRSHRAIAMDRVTSTSCGGCHSRFEPLAFGLERFDGLGSYHLKDEYGNELRQDGEILFPGHQQPTRYENTSQLMDLLAQSDRVSECLTRKVVQFSIGRPLVASDARTIRDIHRQAKSNGGTYSAIIAALVDSDLVQSIASVPQ